MAGGDRPRTPLYPLRRKWLFDVARELQILAGKLAQADASTRPILIDHAIKDLPPATTDLERWFLARFLHDATMRGAAVAPEHAPRTDPPQSPLAAAVADLLATRFAEVWTVRKVAAFFARHPSTIEREMKRAFHVSVHAFLTACRMRAAQRLLAESDWKIEAVGREVGYRSKKNFYEEFRRATGMTPLDFRRAALRQAS